MEKDQNNLRTGIAIGCRTSHELCSNYLLLSASQIYSELKFSKKNHWRKLAIKPAKTIRRCV